jgi:TRAP-type C4-dicarboxylate transport system substrate-binding protein
MSTRSVIVAAAVALAVASSACAGSGADKAGGRAEQVAETIARPVGKPVTLTLVTVDDLWASEFAAAATRLSGGSIRIRTRLGGGWIIDYERRLVWDVRSGKADLVSVGARAWDRMGVTSFQALVAPLLVDSLELQQRILASRSVDRMLESLEPLGLVGLAVLPGPLRRPLGVSRPLVGPRDYAGATIGIRLGGVARATIVALGATSKGYRIGSLAGLDGAELDLDTIVGNGYDAAARALTANVVLWSRPETIVISRDAFRRLSPAQRKVLRRAGREAVAPLLARLEKDENEALAALCDRDKLSLATVSDSELAALRAAVRPVYRQLERDAETRKLVAEIRKLKPGTGSEPLRCSRASVDGAALAGRWSATAHRDELLAAGAQPKETAPGQNTLRLELEGGRWVARLQNGRMWTGTYAVTGDRVRITLETCSHNPCTPDASADYGWSIYRDRLSLTQLPGPTSLWQLTAKPFERRR